MICIVNCNVNVPVPVSVTFRPFALWGVPVGRFGCFLFNEAASDTGIDSQYLYLKTVNHFGKARNSDCAEGPVSFNLAFLIRK